MYSDPAIEENTQKRDLYPVPVEQLPKGIDIAQDYKGFDKSMFSICPREQHLIESVLLSHGQIKDRCDQLAEQIFDDYKG